MHFTDLGFRGSTLLHPAFKRSTDLDVWRITVLSPLVVRSMRAGQQFQDRSILLSVPHLSNGLRYSGGKWFRQLLAVDNGPLSPHGKFFSGQENNFLVFPTVILVALISSATFFHVSFLLARCIWSPANLTMTAFKFEAISCPCFTLFTSLRLAVAWDQQLALLSRDEYHVFSSNKYEHTLNINKLDSMHSTRQYKIL